MVLGGDIDMKIGICTSLDNIEKVAQIGFDYIELAVTEIAGLDSGEFSTAIHKIENSGIACEALNVLFPGNIRLTGQEVDVGKIKEYLDSAFNRVSQLGAKIVVFGSGGPRKIPEGWDKEKAWEQLKDVAKITGDIAGKYDITIAMEPLNKGETNILNSVSEGYRFVQEVDHPNVKLLADFYHMRKESENLSVLKSVASQLVHLHIAEGRDRTYPKDPSEDSYEEFFNILKQVGYDGRCSIEGRTSNIEEDGPIALNLLRKLTE